MPTIPPVTKIHSGNAKVIPQQYTRRHVWALPIKNFTDCLVIQARS
jgi:hypothetical protein